MASPFTGPFSSSDFGQPAILARMFREHVQTEFQFLETRYGFRITESSPVWVGYSTPDVKVIVTQDPRGYEIEVSISLTGAQEASTMEAPLRYILVSRPLTIEPLGGTAAATSELVQKFTRRQAYLLETFAHGSLVGDRREFELLRQWLEPLHRKANERYEYGAMRRRLEVA